MDNELDTILKKSSHLSKKDIFSIPTIKENPVSIFVIKKFTKNDVLDAKSMVNALYTFSTTKNLDEKLKFLFEIYDADSDGYISNAELFDMLKMLNKGILDDTKIQNVADLTFEIVPNYSNKMNFDHFQKLLKKSCTNLSQMFGCTD